MSKHTPGPWRVGDAGTAVFGPPNGNPSPETVAANIRTKANAQLISAAPELLDGLKEIFVMMDLQILVRNTDDDAHSDFSIRMIAITQKLKAAYDAIAKAEGRS